MKKMTILFLGIYIITGCKKDTIISNDSAINLVEASTNTPDIAINFTSAAIPFYQNQVITSYGSSTEYSIQSGSTPFVILSPLDTLKPLFRGSLNLSRGGIYSLYLFDNNGKTDTLFRHDIINNYASSLAGVRFVNLSSDSGPLSVNLQSNSPNQTEFSNIGFTQITDFKTYDARIPHGSYFFEIRQQASGNLLATFRWNYSSSKSNTLVISGSIDPNSATPINVFQVNNY